MFYIDEYKVIFEYSGDVDLSGKNIVDVQMCYIYNTRNNRKFTDRWGQKYSNDIVGYGISVKNPKDRQNNRKIGREIAFLRAVSYLPQELHERFKMGYLRMTNYKTYWDFTVPVNDKLLPNGIVVAENGSTSIK